MSLRRAALLLMLGLLYTLLHKALQTLAPALVALPAVAGLMNLLWLLATLALAWFAYRFLSELSPTGRLIRYSLVAIVAFTGLVMVAHLPVWSAAGIYAGPRLLFVLASLGNACAILAFLLAFRASVERPSVLWLPLRVVTLACALTALMGLVETAYRIAFLLTGQEFRPLPGLRALALLSFVATYGSALWFLIAFRSIEDYRRFSRI